MQATMSAGEQVPNAWVKGAEAAQKTTKPSYFPSKTCSTSLENCPGASSVTSQELRSDSYLSKVPYIEEVKGIKQIAVS